MQHPSMTARGRQIAALVAILVVFFLPKRVRCGYPGADDCSRKGFLSTTCTMSELEPLGLYMIELVVKRDVGFAYTTDTKCR